MAPLYGHECADTCGGGVGGGEVEADLLWVMVERCEIRLLHKDFYHLCFWAALLYASSKTAYSTVLTLSVD